MELTFKNQCFDFLKRYGYQLTQEDSEYCITYVGNNNKVIVIYSEYSKELYCQFEDIRSLKSFSLQDALCYQCYNDFKGLYQISKNEDLYKGLLYLSNVIEKVYLAIDISNVAAFNNIYDYTVEKRNKALSYYYIKEELKKADSFFEKKRFFEARKLYKKNREYLSQVQLKKLLICGNNIYSEKTE